MKPVNLKTRLFLDSGDPQETEEILSVLGFLHGQTTNPLLLSKNPETAGKKFAKAGLLAFYKEGVREVSGLIPGDSVSIEVYADKNTRAEEMFAQGKEMFSWIPNAHVKYPTTAEGLKAARQSIAEGMPQTENGKLKSQDLQPIPYKEINLEQNWESFNIFHELTDQGMERFSADWNNLLQ